MRRHARTLIEILLPSLLFTGILDARPQKADVMKAEEVRLGYKLTLTKCKGTCCHTDSVANGETQLSLYYEGPSFYWGYDSLEQRAGSLIYQPWFKVSRASKGNRFERALAVGFVGREGTMSGTQVTSGEKIFIRKKWEAFPTVSVSGKSYSEGDETITPTLRVTVLKVVR